MSDDRSLDQKLAPQEFVNDFVWAARAVLRQPQVALVTIALWCSPAMMEPANWKPGPIMLVISLLCCFLLVVFCGWMGAERLFFLRQHEGQAVSLAQLFRAARRFFGRFQRLGVLVLIGMVPFTFLLAFLLNRLAGVSGHAWHTPPLQWAMVMAFVVMDFVLSFVPAALVFTTRSARHALGIGWQVIRQTWPRSGLYAICPPLALNLLNSIYPTKIQLVKLATTAGLAVLALIAKGATVAFYLRERPVMPEVVEAPSEAPVPAQ